MQWRQSLVVLSFCDVHLYCLVIHNYDKPYDEVISWSWFHTVISLLPVSLPTNAPCWQCSWWLTYCWTKLAISAAEVLISLLCIAKVCTAISHSGDWHISTASTTDHNPNVTDSQGCDAFGKDGKDHPQIHVRKAMISFHGWKLSEEMHLINSGNSLTVASSHSELCASHTHIACLYMIAYGIITSSWWHTCALLKIASPSLLVCFTTTQRSRCALHPCSTTMCLQLLSMNWNDNVCCNYFICYSVHP